MLQKCNHTELYRDCGLCKNGVHRWEQDRIEYPHGYDLMDVELVDCPKMNRKNIVPNSYEPICENYEEQA